MKMKKMNKDIIHNYNCKGESTEGNLPQPIWGFMGGTSPQSCTTLCMSGTRVKGTH